MSSRIGVIGGSGLYSLFEGSIQYIPVDTPFGSPSDEFALGEISGKEVVFLPRHGRHHQFLPSEINYRANIFGMKKLGVGKIISVSAVGSLRENLKPRDVVIIDQFFDRTNKRPQTFFGNGFVAHAAFGDPVCPAMRKTILKSAQSLPGTFHAKGTYVNMEGPQFSTRAESNYYRSLGFDVIGMTNLSEARLAREAEICYTTLAFVTDYDCWKEDEANVTTDMIIKVLKDNADNAKKIIAAVLKDLDQNMESCTCQQTLKTAMITDPKTLTGEPKIRLFELLKKYL